MALQVLRYLGIVTLFIVSIALSYFLLKMLIRYENKYRLEHQIHRLVVKTHQEKRGTATIGGVAIYLTVLLLTLIFNFEFLMTRNGLGLLFLATSFFLVGLVDDIKKIRERDEKGLSPKMRLVLECLLAIIGLIIIGYNQKTRWLLPLPFEGGFINLSYFVPLLLIFILVGSANASNLVDGLDGLSGGLTTIALTPFLFFAIFKSDYRLALFILTIIGSLLGFLILNIHPAKIFMGDSGSLFLGVLLGTIPIILNRIGEYALIASVYVIECLSVIIQVTYYKVTKKRVFLMAPLHHHYEMKGKSEVVIVMSYYLLGIIVAIFGTLLGVKL